MIPSTPNGELKKLMEERTSFVNSKLKIKLIEESGTPLINILQRNTSKIVGYPCEDLENCLMCRSGNIGKCRISFITYLLECQEPSCPFFYFGETNRNGYSRGCEHLKDSLSKSLTTIEKSIIANHSWQKHEGKPIEIKMKMLKKYRCDPTGRQNAEAILIRNSNQDYLMNSKQEHRQPIDIKEKYENSKGVWEEKKLEKRTKFEKEKL